MATNKALRLPPVQGSLSASNHAARRTKLQANGFDQLWVSGRGAARSLVLRQAGGTGQPEDVAVRREAL
jgi:hypothetical protein